MNELLAYVILFLVGAFMASNIPFLHKLLSLEEFFLGFWRGQAIGDNLKKRRKKK